MFQITTSLHNFKIPDYNTCTYRLGSEHEIIQKALEPAKYPNHTPVCIYGS